MMRDVEQHSMKHTILNYIDYYHQIIEGRVGGEHPIGTMPGKNYFIGEDILVIPSGEGESRYPYGKNGFNYWTYANGYIHCNEGLFSPFLRAAEGAEPKIAFFVGINEESSNSKQSVFSMTSVPCLENEPDNLHRFTVFSKAATFYIVETEQIYSCMRTFVVDKNIYFSLWVMNKTEEALQIFVSSYMNPFLKNALIENSTDRWFRQVKYNKDQNLGYFTLETYEEKDRGIMSTNFGLIRRASSESTQIQNCSATTSRYGYVGGNTASLHASKVLRERDICEPKHATTFSETGICSDFVTIQLENECQLDMELCYTFEEAVFATLSKESITCDLVEQAYLELVKSEKPYSMNIQCEALPTNGGILTGDLLTTGEPLPIDDVEQKPIHLPTQVFNPFIHHLMKQVEFCSEIKGFIQLSHFSLIGIRDIFQAIEGYLFYRPLEAKTKMLEALSFGNLEGRMPRQYSLPKHVEANPAMDLRPFIDQGVWVISTISTYLKFTKDDAFLESECGYYDFVNEKSHIAVKNKHTDSVLVHLIRIMDYLLSNRDMETTHCIKALYGDWNDALDGLGKSSDPQEEYGTGVSVMATLQVYQNLNEMIEILGLVLRKDQMTQEAYCEINPILHKYALEEGSLSSLIAYYQAAAEEIVKGLFTYAIQEERIVHGWGDKLSYFVGSNKDPDGVQRDGITSNAFWILSGLMKCEAQNSHRKEYILNAYNRLESKYGLKTFEPAFEKGTYGVGRIPNLPAGTAENGATYIHASMFAVMSLFAIGESKLAWEEMVKLLPFTHDKVSVSPFVVPNSYGLNAEFNIDGESMQDWQTGSSNVMLKTLIRFGVGFEPTYDGIRLQPPAFQPFASLKLSLVYLDRCIEITHRKETQGAQYNREFFMNSVLVESVKDVMMGVSICHIPDSLILVTPKNGTINIEIIDRKVC